MQQQQQQQQQQQMYATNGQQYQQCNSGGNSSYYQYCGSNVVGGTEAYRPPAKIVKVETIEDAVVARLGKQQKKSRKKSKRTIFQSPLPQPASSSVSVGTVPAFHTPMLCSPTTVAAAVPTTTITTTTNANANAINTATTTTTATVINQTSTHTKHGTQKQHRQKQKRTSKTSRPNPMYSQMQQNQSFGATIPEMVGANAMPPPMLPEPAGMLSLSEQPPSASASVAGALLPSSVDSVKQANMLLENKTCSVPTKLMLQSDISAPGVTATPSMSALASSMVSCIGPDQRVQCVGGGGGGGGIAVGCDQQKIQCAPHKRKNNSAVHPTDDGYKWRKYGQKNAKGLIRSYYKCVVEKCPAKV